MAIFPYFLVEGNKVSKLSDVEIPATIKKIATFLPSTRKSVFRTWNCLIALVWAVLVLEIIGEFFSVFKLQILQV